MSNFEATAKLSFDYQIWISSQCISLTSFSSLEIWLDDVDCRPSDTTLLSCDHRGIGLENCDHSEDVALECIGDGPRPSEVIALFDVALLASSYLSIYKVKET